MTLWYWYERNWKKQRLLMEMEIVSDRNTPQGIETNILQYRIIALISADIVPSFDIKGRELASVRRYPNEGQYSPISVR